MKHKKENLESILRDIQKMPEPLRYLEINTYIKHLGEVRDESHYYRQVAKRLYQRIYGVEYKER